MIQILAANQSKDVAWTEPPPIEKLNWLIHLTHARGDIASCKNLINEEIQRSFGRNEYAYYQKVPLKKIYKMN